jgi:hypothetical protein
MQVRDHTVDDYAVLLDMDETDVGILTDDDRDCLNNLGEYLVSVNAWSRFGIWLLHKHFEPAPGEIFVERTVAEHRRTTTTPFPRTAFSSHELFATAIRFETANETGLVGMEFTTLADLEPAAPLSPSDEAVLTGLAGILESHGKADRFGVRLIRDRLGITNDEVLLETCNTEARTLHCAVADRGPRSTRIDTTWQWKPEVIKTSPTPVMTCQIVKQCFPRSDGGHNTEIQHIPVNLPPGEDNIDIQM